MSPMIVTTMTMFLPAANNREHRWLPGADIYRSPSGWLIKLDLAGVRREDVEIVSRGTCLTIRGCRRDWIVDEDWSHYSMEIAYSRFERTIELPCLVEHSKINAELRDGMLMIYLMIEGEEQ